MAEAVTTSTHCDPESFISRCSNSPISPGNSKWLQQNTIDMDNKVKAIVSLIKEDASSFNRKAEMYFRKRPELIKLIEELYRAYRALAERYDFTSGELNFAHRAMTKAFPSQILFEETEDYSASISSAYQQSPQTPEIIIQNVKKSLICMQDEKENALLKYQHTMKKLSDLEEELNIAQISLRELCEQENKAKAEVQTLKEEIAKVEVERDAAFLQQKELIGRFSNLESKISQVRKEGVNNEALRVEIQSQCLGNEVSRLEAEKKVGSLQYEKCLEKMSNLEKRNLIAEEEAELLQKRAHKAEVEVRKLQNDLNRLNEEKESVAIEYEHCLANLSKLESELTCAQEKIIDTERLKSAEERRVKLDISNKYLKSEAINLELEIEIKDEELLKKQDELEKLRVRVENDHLRFVQVEAAIRTLQNFHSQSQEEHESMKLEVGQVLQILKEFDISQHELAKDENLQCGISRLKEIKEKLEGEVDLWKGVANTLQKQIYFLKEDILGLRKRYYDLIEKIELTGLKPECVGSSIKALRDENSNLRQIYKDNKEVKAALLEQLDIMEQLMDKNSIMKNSLSREKLDGLQNSIQWLNENKSSLFSGKDIPFCELQHTTNSVEKLSQKKNTVLENPLYVANIELESLNSKSENSEKFNLVHDRSKMIVLLDNVQQRLGSLEERFSGAEQKCRLMEKEKEPTLTQAQSPRTSLGLEKREHTSLDLSSEARLDSLKKHIHFLQEETRSRKTEFEEEVDRSVYAHFEIFILHSFIQDLEYKNHSLSVECEKYDESAKSREKLVSELESENLEQQVEIELLINDIEKLRSNICQVFKALEFSHINESDNIGSALINVHRIIDNIKDTKDSLSSREDERQKLLVENSILLVLLRELNLEGAEIILEKEIIDQKFKTIAEELLIVKNDKQELFELGKELKSEIRNKQENVETLEAEIDRQFLHQSNIERDYLNLEKENCQILGENRTLMKIFEDLKKDKGKVEEENDSILIEALVLENLCTVFRNMGTEKDMDIVSISKDLQSLHMINENLENEVDLLRKKTEIEERENLNLKSSVTKMEIELHEVDGLNEQLKKEISDQMEIICQKEVEICLEEEKLKAADDLALELWRTVESLKGKHKETELMKENLEKEIVELSGKNKVQDKEIQSLHEVNGDLKNEFEVLNNKLTKEISDETETLCQKDIECSLSQEILKATDDMNLVLFRTVEELKGINEETMLVKEKLEKEIIEISEENENQGKEIRSLREVNGNLSLEMQLVKKEDEDINDQLRKEISAETEKLCQKDIEFSLTQEILKATDDLNSVLCRTVEELKGKNEETISVKEKLENEIIELSEEKENHGKEIQFLREVNRNFTLELEEMRSDFEVWEAEASKFHFDLQISAVREVVLEKKIHELTAVFESLENESASKSVEMEKMKERVDAMEDEIGCLKGQLSAYSPVIERIRENMASLENKILSQPKLVVNDNNESHDSKDMEGLVHLQEKSYQKPTEEHRSVIPNRIEELQELQMRIKSLEKVVIGRKNKVARQTTTPKLQEDDKQKEEMEPKHELVGTFKSQKMNVEIVQHIEDVNQRRRNLSSSLQEENEPSVDKIEVPSSIKESNLGQNQKMISETDSSMQQLVNLQETMEDLKRKLVRNSTKKLKVADTKRMKRQLKDVEGTLVQLIEVNGQFKMSPEGDPPMSNSNALAKGETENIEKLLSEVQHIKNVLFKVENGKSSGGEIGFLKNGTNVILKNLFWIGRRSGQRRRKSSCRCFRPSANRETNI